MGISAPTPPTPPNPNSVASAQTGSNIGTAFANTVLGNANQVTPFGNVNYNQIGQQTIQIPQFDAQGNPTGQSTSYSVPQYQQSTTLAPAQQQMLELQNQTGVNLNQLAVQQSSALQGLLGHPVSAAQLPGMAQGSLAAPALSGLPSGPSYQTPTLTQQTGSTAAPVGGVPVGQAQTGYNYSTTPTSFASAGQVRSAPGLMGVGTNLGNVGSIQGQLGIPGNTQTGVNQQGYQGQVGPQDFSQDATNVQHAILSRLQPQLDYTKNQLDNKLVNEGLQPGSQAYDQRMKEFNQQANDAQQQAVLAGYQEQQNLFNMNLQQGQFANTASQLTNTSALNAGNFANQAQQQQFSQAALAGQFGNAAQQQAYQQLLSGGQFNLTATGQNNAALLAQQQAANSAQQQQYGQNLGAAQFGQAATAQNNAAGLAAGQFGNQATAQNNAANLAGGQFSNQAQAQSYAQQQAQLAFNNAVQTQGAEAANQIAQQAYQNTLNQVTQQNQNAQQQFTNMLTSGQFQNAAQAQAYAQMLGLQSFPINEITALMSGGQVQVPQGQYQGGQVQPTPAGNYIYDTAALNQQNYQSQLASQNATQGGIFGLLGTSALAAAKFSDRRLKADIEDTGLRFLNGLKVYTFRYLNEAIKRVGLMSDDVRKIRPQTVFNLGGYDAVDYNAALA